MAMLLWTSRTIDSSSYAGRSCLWSTDHKRQKRFDDPHDASTVCHELRSLCPRNAKVINIEVAQDDPSVDQVPAISLV